MKKQIKEDLFTMRVNEKEANMFKSICEEVGLTRSSVFHFVMAEVNSGRMVLDYETVKNTIKK